MLSFKKLEYTDIPVIKKYFDKSNFLTCDYTLLGLYMWVEFFGYEMAEKNGILFLRTTKGQTEYLLPLSSIVDSRECIDRILEYEKSLGNGRTTFICVPEDCLSTFTGKHAEYLLDRDWSDYTYSAKNLALLEGKKFSKKRNLIHQFLKSHPNFIFTDIDESNVSEVAAFNDTAFDTKELSELASYEHEETRKVLERFFDFGCIGSLLKVDGKTVAFTIGEIKNGCLFIHVEKALKDYKGVYQMVNMLFCKSFYEKGAITLVNREEDLGDEGLRHSKSSYYPDMIYKYKVVIDNEN